MFGNIFKPRSISFPYIKKAFLETIEAEGGRAVEVEERKEWLSIRAVLPWADNVRQRDQMRAGVALRSDRSVTEVQPYLFRIVCSNGMIVGDRISAPEKIHIPDVRINKSLREEFHDRLHDAITACNREELFTKAMEALRESTRRRAEMDARSVLFQRVRRIWQEAGRHSVPDEGTRAAPARGASEMGSPQQFTRRIRGRFEEEGDGSLFALANAVTSVARDTRDPWLKWELEALGGRIALPRLLAVGYRERDEAIA